MNGKEEIFAELDLEREELTRDELERTSGGARVDSAFDNIVWRT